MIVLIIPNQPLTNLLREISAIKPHYRPAAYLLQCSTDRGQSAGCFIHLAEAKGGWKKVKGWEGMKKNVPLIQGGSRPGRRAGGRSAAQPPPPLPHGPLHFLHKIWQAIKTLLLIHFTIPSIRNIKPRYESKLTYYDTLTRFHLIVSFFI